VANEGSDGDGKSETEERPLRTEFWVAQKMAPECKSGKAAADCCLNLAAFPTPLLDTGDGLARGS